MQDSTAQHLVQELHRLTEATERSAKAQEDLIELAKDERSIGEQIENEPGPPFCPRCSKIDPLIYTEGRGEGQMAKFVLVARCGSCQGVLFAVPEGWRVFSDSEEADEYRNSR